MNGWYSTRTQTNSLLEPRSKEMARTYLRAIPIYSVTDYALTVQDALVEAANHATNRIPQDDLSTIFEPCEFVGSHHERSFVALCSTHENLVPYLQRGCSVKHREYKRRANCEPNDPSACFAVYNHSAANALDLQARRLSNRVGPYIKG